MTHPILHLFLAAAPAGGVAADKHMLEQLGFSWQHLLSQMIVFILVAWALKRFAFDPTIEMLEARREKIRESMANAEKIKKELAEAEAMRKEIVAKANDQAAKIVAEAHAAAEAQGEKKLQEAIAEAEHMIAKAKEAIELDRQKMKADLKAEIASLVVKTTAAVAAKVLTPDDQRRLNSATEAQLASKN
jgi:F-type H+-transporting ATPase subunit b